MDFRLILILSVLFFGAVHSQGYALQTRYVFFVSDGQIYLTYTSTLQFGPQIWVPNLPLDSFTQLAAASISRRSSKSGIFLVYQDSKGDIIQTHSTNNGVSWSLQTAIVSAGGLADDSPLRGTYLAYTILPTTLDQYVFWQDSVGRVRLAYYNNGNNTWSVLKSINFGFEALLFTPLTSFSWDYPAIRAYFQDKYFRVIEIVEGRLPVNFNTHSVANFSETVKKWAGVYTQPGDTIDIFYPTSGVIRDLVYVYASWGIVGAPAILENWWENSYGGFAASTDLSYVYLYVQGNNTNAIWEYFVGHGYAHNPHGGSIAGSNGFTPIAATII